MSDILTRLWDTIANRANADPASSHTAAMLAKGPAKCAEKFGEEAIELIIAAAQADRTEIRHEAADVLYHLMVLLRATDVNWDEVLETLDARTAQSGIEEKASR